uniref:uncharacterized protein LOC120329506 isoform X2 n=1 Tax=Styela clava TaxID=7725 RepID=UPI00193AC5D4|nr:uncharacterized protein LOC120329506 isoform X2 [Styela clava]
MLFVMNAAKIEFGFHTFPKESLKMFATTALIKFSFCEKCKRAFCIKCLDASDHHKNKDNICDNCKDDESERRSSSSGRAGSYDPTDLSDNCCDSDCCMLFCECMELGVAIGELCCCLGGIICSDPEDD